MRRCVRALLVVGCALLASAGPGMAVSQAGAPALATLRVASGLSFPVLVTAPVGDPRLFIVEQGGKIRIVSGGALLLRPFLDVSNLTVGIGERGLLGLAFAPDYAATGLFYINYTDNTGNTVIARYRVSGNPNVANAASAEVLLTIVQPDLNHNGGHLAFGPDGYLYIGMGDGGGVGDPPDNGQRDDTLLGKMLRIDVGGGLGSGYSIPPTNPHAGPGDPLDEIWAKGLRNPYRWSFDRATGDLYIGDVGQGRREEIDFEPAGDAGGRNYGWRLMEGSLCFNPPTGCQSSQLELPLYEYGHAAGRCAVTGGYSYRGGITAAQGRYFFADYCTGEIWSFRRDPVQGAVDLIDHSADLQPAIGSIGNVSGFGEDGFGELYIVDRGGGGDGEVYKIVGLPSGHLLDAFGAFHAIGGAASILPPPQYFGFDAAIDAVLAPAGVYVLDRFGGLHSGGGAPTLSPAPPYFGFDVARDLELVGSGAYVLDGFGGVHAAGGAPPVSLPSPYFGLDVARDLEPAGSGFYVLDGFGGIHPGNGAPVLSPATPYFGFDIARDMEVAPLGFFVLDGFGGVHAGGGAVRAMPSTPYFGFDIARDLEIAPTGYYVMEGRGLIYAGGGAPAFSPPMPFFGIDAGRDFELRD